MCICSPQQWSEILLKLQMCFSVISPSLLSPRGPRLLLQPSLLRLLWMQRWRTLQVFPEGSHRELQMRRLCTLETMGRTRNPAAALLHQLCALVHKEKGKCIWSKHCRNQLMFRSWGTNNINIQLKPPCSCLPPTFSAISVYIKTNVLKKGSMKTHELDLWPPNSN